MRGFRAGYVVYVVAWLLVVLGASPVTAPFSTFVQGDASKHGKSEHPSLDQLKAAKDKTVDFVSSVVFVPRPQIVDAVATTFESACPAHPHRRDVLRI